MKAKLRRDMEEIKRLYESKEDMDRQIALLDEIGRLAEILDCHKEVLAELNGYFSEIESNSAPQIDIITYRNGYEIKFIQDKLPEPYEVIEVIMHFKSSIIEDIEELSCSKLSRALKLTSSNDKPLVLNFTEMVGISNLEFEQFYNTLGIAIREVVGRC